MAVPYIFSPGDACSPAKVNADLAALDAATSNIMGYQVNSNAGIAATAIEGTLETNATLRDDLLDLWGKLAASVAVSVGGYSPWLEMLPVMGATAISVSGTTDLKVTIAAGGMIKMLGHDFTTKAVTAMGTDGKAGGVAMDAESVYALRLTSGAPPTGESAHVQESDIDTMAVHFELVKLTASRFSRGTITGVTSSTVWTCSDSDVQGARIRFLNGSCSNAECTVPWSSAGTVYLTDSIGTPSSGDKILINKDKVSIRTAETSGTLGGPSSPTSALIAIIATMQTGVAPAVLLQPCLGGTYKYDRSLVVESDWSSEISTDGTEHTITWEKPYDGLRLKNISGWIAMAKGAAPTRVAMRPLFSGAPLDGTVAIQSGTGYVIEVWRGSGLELRLRGDGVGITAVWEGWPWSGTTNPADMTHIYDRCKVKIFAEYAP